MADPLERLRDVGGGGPPEGALIRDRARRIQTRRYAALGTSLGMVLLVVGAGLVLPRALDQRGRIVATESSRSADDTGAAGQFSEPAAEDALPLTGPAATAAAPVASAPQQSETSSREGRAAASGVASDRVGERAVEALEVRITASKAVVTPGEAITFRTEACNTASHEVEPTFPTTQRFDVTVRAAGQEWWTWSHDQGFAQVVQTERVKPGGCMSFQFEWNGTDKAGRPLAPGRYEAVGTLTSSPRKQSAPIEVCSVSCG